MSQPFSAARLRRSASFRRLTGVSVTTFDRMLRQLRGLWDTMQANERKSCRPWETGGLEDHRLIMLIYYRCYVSQEFVGFFYRVDKSVICRAIRPIECLATPLVGVRREPMVSREGAEAVTAVPNERSTDAQPIEPVLIRGNGAGDLGSPSAAVDPARLYDTDYMPILATLIREIVAAETVVTLRRLARLIARRHGFQRTGREIVRLVRETADPLERVMAAQDSEEVVWSSGTEPTPTMAFRGLSIGEETRPWVEVPYPEKIGFAVGFLDRADPVRAMADALKLGRLTAPTREEFEALLMRARDVSS